MLKFLVPAAFVALLPASAFAAPPPSGPAFSQSASIQLVDMRRDHHRADRKADRHDRHRFKAGSRYRSAPRGWRSHRARPSDWRTRGCVMVGPLWFCP